MISFVWSICFPVSKPRIQFFLSSARFLLKERSISSDDVSDHSKVLDRFFRFLKYALAFSAVDVPRPYKQFKDRIYKIISDGVYLYAHISQWEKLYRTN